MERKTPSTIRVRKETVKRLRKIGRFGESYNDTINRLLENHRPIKYMKWRDEDLEIVEEPTRKRKIRRIKTIERKKQK